ncbi:hypothetical protein [Streptomyces tritici]|uniref:hypothetical protein n=1 Tax=Streptomyces tritici TaxID=2054410 RepID=UPI003AEFBA21
MGTEALTRRRSALAALVATTVALGGTACGPRDAGPFEGLTGPRIADRAIEATKAADSLTLDLDVTSASGPLKAYLAVDRRGRCAGTLTLGVAGTAELIRTGDAVYMRYDEAFLRERDKDAPAARRKAVQKELRRLKERKGKWVRTGLSAPEAREGLELCDLDALLGRYERAAGSAAVDGRTSVNGRTALRLTERRGAERTTLYVAAEGEPRLLKIVTRGGERPGTIAFPSYDAPVPATRPAAGNVVERSG